MRFRVGLCATVHIADSGRTGWCGRASLDVRLRQSRGAAPLARRAALGQSCNFGEPTKVHRGARFFRSRHVPGLRSGYTSSQRRRSSDFATPFLEVVSSGLAAVRVAASGGWSGRGERRRARSRVRHPRARQPLGVSSTEDAPGGTQGFALHGAGAGVASIPGGSRPARDDGASQLSQVARSRREQRGAGGAVRRR